MAPLKEIRVVQLIDSLEAGGAERMAVNYANALNKHMGFTALVATRHEGSLKHQLEPGVAYKFLNRKSIFDFRALLSLRIFVIQNQISHIHAHSTSLFFALLIKIIYPKIQLIWHDHYGKSEMLEQRPIFAIRVASFFVSKTIAVNQKLKKWSEEKLWCKNVIYLPNFTSTTFDLKNKTTFLKGESGKRILCLANLRPQKNHIMLIDIAKEIQNTYSDWTFHLVGKDFDDDYSKSLKEAIRKSNLEETVFIYGSKEDIPFIISQATIGILTSASEGLPVALLEYGFYKLPVISTNVGEIPTVITAYEGVLVESNDSKSFVNHLKTLIADCHLQKRLATQLHNKIVNYYSENGVILHYIQWINEK